MTDNKPSDGLTVFEVFEHRPGEPPELVPSYAPDNTGLPIFRADWALNYAEFYQAAAHAAGHFTVTYEVRPRRASMREAWYLLSNYGFSIIWGVADAD